MSITKILPAHVLRLYAWEVLKLNTDLDIINGLVPIVALQDEPQIADAQKTYLIYGYAENNDPRQYEIRRGIMVFRVKSRHFGELGQITNAITRAFENGDISAAQVNEWSSSNEAHAFAGIRFTTTDVVYVEGGTPEESEAGPESGLVNVAYEVIINDTSFILPSPADRTLWS